MESTIYSYLRHHASELGARILEMYPPLQAASDPTPPGLKELLRSPLPAQAVAVGGLVKHLRTAKSARIVGECGTGKTYMALAVAHVFSAGRPYTALVMCPSHIAKKWAREALKTIPLARTFLIEDMRNGGDPKQPHGICEVRLKRGRVVYEGQRLSLAELRTMGRKGWRDRCPRPAIFIIPKDKGKLSYFWRPAYVQAGSGLHRGGVVNPDTGVLIRTSEGESYTRLDFDKLKVAETVERPNGGSKNFSAVWQADSKKIQRMAPVEYIGRYMRGWFDFAIADELHQLAGDTAQGNGLGVLERAALKLIGLTGTLMGGYADDLFNIFYRMEADRIVREGFAHGGEGRREFQEQFGVLETIERITESDNACTRASKKTVQILKKPGASPLLFGKFLMSSTAFVSLEDIADNLPSYDERVLPSEMDEELATAYRELERDLREAMQENRGNKSLMSTLLNTLLLYPDHPYGFDEIWARRFDPVAKRYERFFVTAPAELSQKHTYAKEADLIRDIQEELRLGRRCQVYATFTGEKDINGRLEAMLRQARMRVAVLRASVPTHKREEWYERQLESGVEVVICHPKLVETGLDLLAFPTLYFYQTGYSLHTLRQASRRSWRIGQRLPVRVKFLTYKGTMQETCLRLMGRKMLVALMMEGKFSGEGLQSLDADEDLMSAMARELVERAGVGQSADAVWAELKRERAMHVPSMLVGSQMEPGEEGDPSWPLLSQEPVAASLPVPHLVEPTPKRQQKPSRLWPTGHTEGEQMLLFA